MPQQCGSRPGQSVSAPHRISPGESKQAAGRLQLVESIWVDRQQIEPAPHEGVSRHPIVVPAWQVSCAPMHDAPEAPF